MESGSVKKNTYFLAASQVGQLSLAFLLVYVIADRLGDEKFGVYMFGTVMAYFIQMLNDLGANIYITREAAKDRANAARYFWNGAALKLILLVPAILFVLTYLLTGNFTQEKIWVVIWFGLFGLLSSYNQLCHAMYRAYERMEFEMGVLMFEKVLITSLGIVFVLQGKGVTTLCAAYAIAAAFQAVGNTAIMRRKFIRTSMSVDRAFMNSIFKSALVFGLFWIISNVHERIDVLMLERMTRDEIVGWYTLAYKLILVAGVIPLVLMMSTFPRISNLWHSDRGEVGRIFGLGFKYLFFIALPLVIGVQFLSEAICVFFNPEFLPAAKTLRLLMLAGGIDFFSVLFGGVLMASNRQKRMVWLQAGALVVNVGVNAFLIPHYQHIGAVIATLISRGLIFLFCAVWIRELFSYIDYRAVVKGVLAAGFMTLFLWWWQGPFLIETVMAAVIYGSILWALRGFRIEELLVIRQGK